MLHWRRHGNVLHAVRPDDGHCRGHLAVQRADALTCPECHHHAQSEAYTFPRRLQPCLRVAVCQIQARRCTLHPPQAACHSPRRRCHRRPRLDDAHHPHRPCTQRGHGHRLYQCSGVAGQQSAADIPYIERGGSTHQRLAAAAHLLAHCRQLEQLRAVVVERQLHAEAEEMGRAHRQGRRCAEHR